MGQEIVYCSRCQTQLRGRDFEKGAAFRLDSMACCLKCAPDVMKSLPNAAVQDLLKQMAAPRNSPRPSESSGRVQPAGSSTGRIAVVGRRSRTPGPSGLFTAAAVGLGVAGLLGVVVLSSAKPANESRVPSAPVARDVPPEPSPKPPAVEEARREPDPPSKAAGERIAAELGALDQATRESCGQERFQEALDRLEAARGRVNAPDWTVGISRRVDDVHRQASGLYAAVKEAARTKEDAAALRARVARWGIPKFVADLEAAPAEKPPPAPEPKSAPPSPEAVAFARCREAAFHHALARDYASATAELKRGIEALRDDVLRKGAAEDVDVLQQAARALQDLRQEALKWTKGRKLSLEFVNAAGAVDRVEGTVLRTDPFRVELERAGAEPAVLLLEEVRAGSLAKALKESRGTLPTAEARALALLCLLEGEPEAARGLADIPDRYGVREAAVAPARELEARSLLYSAERAYEDPAFTAEAARTHASLLKDYADTRVVRRNRAFIASRSQGGKDYLFFPEDMTAGGAFARVRNPKTETCFSSDADVDAGKAGENYVEVAFSSLPDVEYRGWAYVGACCAETFAFSWQATGLAGLLSKDAKEPAACEPGGAAWLPVKHTLVSLKKTHALHGGPKGPTRWEWIPLPLPKAAVAGPRRLRLLTNQRGFSVAFVAIGAAKSHPRESELKAARDARNRTPGARTLNRSAPPPAEKPAAPELAVLYSLSLEGGKKPVALSTGSVVKAPDRPENRWCLGADSPPSGVSPLFLSDGGVGLCAFEGEEILTFEYWVDGDAETINFNFSDRPRGEQHYGQLDNLVKGKWTRASFRLADLRGPPFRPGDLVAGLYMQAVGGSTRRFFVDNIQIVRPRPRK